MMEKEQDVQRLTGEVSALTDALDAMKSQVEEARRRSDDDTKRAVEKALEKVRKEKGTLDEAAASELRTKLDAAQVSAEGLSVASLVCEHADLHSAAGCGEATLRVLS